MSLDKNIIQTFSDPLIWCESYLRNPRDRDKPLKLRSYQAEVLSNSRKYQNMILRWGRRLGKTISMCADCLWWAQAYPLIRMIENGDNKIKPFRILIFTPYESQVDELWLAFSQLIGDSPLLKDQVIRIRTSDTYLIEFKGQGNSQGSTIEGHTIGISSANQGTSLRSLSGDMVFIDEMDYVPQEIVERVIFPITTTHPDVKRRICSTPSGKREQFYKWCSEATELGWFHSHYPSWHPDNDRWMSEEQARQQGRPIQDSTEFQARHSTTSATYEREYGAEFGEEFGGVYKHKFLGASLIKYGRNIDLKDPDIFNPDFPQNPEHKYIIGVDWNSYINGGQIVMIEYCSTPTFVSYYDDEKKQDITIDFTGHYRLFYRRGIKAKDATQRQTRQEIIRLLTTYKIDYIYVDYGAGDTNIEELTLFGSQHPELNLNRKLRVIDSGAVVEHYDHVAQKMIKKRNKSLMVNFSVISLEEGMMILPKEEDEANRLIGQMRGYTVKNITSRGEFAYQGDDHILDAFNLAIYGFQQNFGELLSRRSRYVPNTLPDPRLSLYPHRTLIEEQINNMTSRNMNTYTMAIRDPDKPISIKRGRRFSMPGFGSREINIPSKRKEF